METDGMTMVAAAAALGISARTIRRYVRAYRDAVGAAREGVLAVRGHRVAFRQQPGVRNDEYRFWVDDLPPSAADPPDFVETILRRLDAMQSEIAALQGRVDRLEDGADTP